MDAAMRWYMEDRGKRAMEALKKRNFSAFYLDSVVQARETVLREIPLGATVGIGGSVTVRGMKIPEELRARGNKVIDHWEAAPNTPENYATRRAQQTCDVFLSSANAITLEGQLVNTDGAGNRVNALAFGPRKAIIVAGVNKIVPDLESAFRRIKDVAVPLNCHRLNATPPCIQAGRCVDCRVPQRVCRITTIIEWKPPFFSDYVILIVGENLGY